MRLERIDEGVGVSVVCEACGRFVTLFARDEGSPFVGLCANCGQDHYGLWDKQGRVLLQVPPPGAGEAQGD